MKIFYFLCVLWFLYSCSSHVNREILNDYEVIYLKKDTKVIDVYNMSKNWVSSEDISYIENRNYQYGEFGGRLKNCSDEEYFCLVGGISIVIPKQDWSKDKWGRGKVNCEVEGDASADEKQVVCQRESDFVKFSYSRDRGVLSYVRSKDPDHEYELYDQKGLFFQQQ